jgi:hypothetical protein
MPGLQQHYCLDLVVQAPVEYVAEIVAALDQKLKGLEYRIVVRCS